MNTFRRKSRKSRVRRRAVPKESDSNSSPASPTHAAAKNGLKVPTADRLTSENAARNCVRSGSEKYKSLRVNDFFGGVDCFIVKNPITSNRNQRDKTGNRSGNADVENGAARRHRRNDFDKRAESSGRTDERRHRNKIRQSRVNAVKPARDIMSGFVRRQNRQQREARISNRKLNVAKSVKSV